MEFITSPYLIIFSLLTLFSFMSIEKTGVKFSNVFLFISFLLLWLFAGLRKYSPDQAIYTFYFEKIPPLFDYSIYNTYLNPDDQIEQGFLIFLSSLKLITNNEVILFLILAFVPIAIVIYCCKKLSPYPMLSVLIYFSWFYYFNIGALRHAYVSSFLLLTILFFVNKRMFKSWFMYLISVSFHKTSLFGGVIFLIKKIRPNPSRYLGILFIALFIGVIGGLFHNTFNYFYEFMPKDWQFKMYLYLNTIYDTDFAGKTALFKGASIKSLIIILLALNYYSILLNKYKDKFEICFGVYFFALILMFLLIDFKIASDRVYMLLGVTEIIIIPMLLSAITIRERIYVLLIIFALMLIQVFKLYGSQFYYYQSILTF